jgi:hypothetical protein
VRVTWIRSCAPVSCLVVVVAIPTIIEDRRFFNASFRLLLDDIAGLILALHSLISTIKLDFRPVSQSGHLPWLDNSKDCGKLIKEFIGNK